jgi:hypothetical protein
MAYDSDGNATTRDIRFTMRPNGANGLLLGTPYVSSGSDDAVEIASLTFTLVDDASGVLLRCANASGSTVSCRIVDMEMT